MRNRILIFAISLTIILTVLIDLNFSNQFNNFLFSALLSPYDPLLIKVPGKGHENLNGQFYWKDPRGRFPIFAYNIPDKTKDLIGSLKIIEKGGINIVINANMSGINKAYKIREAFENLKNSDLKWLVIIENECRNDFIYGNSNDQTNVDIKKYLRNFNDDFVYGWCIWDEPGRNRKACTPFNMIPNDDNADINRMVKQIRSDSVFNKKLDYVNLFPTYWEGTPDIKAYEKYIDEFISSQEFKPRVLSFDHYPFLKPESGGHRRDFYANLTVIRRKSLEYNIPFWMIVLSSEHYGYKNVTIQEISLQVYSALAYGAKGIGYYLYSRSLENDTYKSWILERNIDNDKVADTDYGPLFVPVKRLNEQIQTLGKTLLSLESIKVIHSSDYPNKQSDILESVLKVNRPNSIIKSINKTDEPNSDPKVLVGMLKVRETDDNRGTYLLVVNKDILKKTSVNVLLNNIFKIYKYDTNSGERNFINKGDLINTNILPGSGELFYIE